MTDYPSDFDSANSPQSADWEAIARHVAGEDTPESSARFGSLAGHDAERDLIASLHEITGRMAAGTPSNLDVEAALNTVKSKIGAASRPALRVERGKGVQPSPSPRWRVPFPAIAAVGLVAVGLGTWLTLGRKSDPAVVPATRMVATGVGMRDSLTLSDGTKVVLGPLSSVKVSTLYGSASREVEVQGESYFEVVHNASKPFTVHIGNATVQDIGTKFAVRSNDSGDIGVSVSEGSVSLAQAKTPADAVVLKAGDQGTLERGGKVTTRRGAATEDDMAWLTGRLVFRETPLSEVASSMRRWYGINLQIADPSLADRHITATFSGEPPDRVLEVLRLALGADIERHGDTAVVRQAKGRAR